MKLGIIRSAENQFEEAERLLERELTPDECRWLTLADELLRRDKVEYIAAIVRSKAA